MTTVREALRAVMKDVGAVKKGDRNTQGNFNFRGIDAVTNAVYPALVEHGVMSPRGCWTTSTARWWWVISARRWVTPA